jgi:molybdenum cofactor sulfurtransferase
MALIRPVIDFQAGALRVHYLGTRPPGVPEEIRIPLSANPSFYKPVDGTRSLSSRVCGDAIVTHTYANPEINNFFSSVLDVPCVLARFPAGGSGLSGRHAKAHMQKHQRPKKISSNSDPGFLGSLTPPDSDSETQKRPILLSNESPILAINRSSLDALNEEIIKGGGSPASAAVFRANVILAPSNQNTQQQPYSEDHWTKLRIGQQEFQMLGSCRRCHMICINQNTAEKDKEPFVTLAKTRRFDSKIFFGSHMCHIPSKNATRESQCPTIKVGDIVSISMNVG